MVSQEEDSERDERLMKEAGASFLFSRWREKIGEGMETENGDGVAVVWAWVREGTDAVFLFVSEEDN